MDSSYPFDTINFGVFTVCKKELVLGFTEYKGFNETSQKYVLDAYS